MEGKEIRFGIANSALWATATTAASNGSVNAMHDSFTPLGGLVPMWLMQLGEVIFGGVGSGLYGMIDLRHRRGVRRRSDDRPHARVPRQEDRGLRDEDGVARDPDSAARGAVRHRDRRAGRAGQGRRRQSGRARLLRDPVRVLLGRQQQRQRLCRPVREHAVLQHGARHRDVVRALLARRFRCSRIAGSAGRQEDRAGRRGHAADAHAAVRGAADRHRAPRRRAHLRAGARAGPDRRAPACSGSE